MVKEAALRDVGGTAVDERGAFAFLPLSPILENPTSAAADALAPVRPSSETTVVIRTVPDRRVILRFVRLADRRAVLAIGPNLRAHLARALEDEVAFGTLFLLLPVFLMAGALIYFSLPAEPLAQAIPLGIAVIGVLWRLALRHSVSAGRLVLAPLVVVFGMGVAQWHTHRVATPMLGSEVTTRLSGTIERVELRPDGSARLTITVAKTERPTLRHGPDRVRATVRRHDPKAVAGAEVSGLVRLQPPSGPARPGAYDFRFRAYFDGIGANGFFLGAPQIAAAADPGTWLRAPGRRLEQVRQWLSNRIRSLSPGDAGAVAAALVTGDRAAISEPVNEALRVTGLAHMLSISGLHMALVAGTVMLILRATLALFPVQASLRSGRKQAALVAFAVITVYLFLAGASIPTQRSYVMLAVMLLALNFDRAALTKRNIALAALGVTLLAPDAVSGPGFQMSFAATLALIAVYDLWSRRRRRAGTEPDRTRRFKWISTPLAFMASLAATSLIAGTATGLFSAYHFHRVSVLGLPANLAAMPIVSFITMPAALAGTLAAPFGLDAPFFRLMAASLQTVIEIADWIAKASPAGLVGAISLPALFASTAALLVFCVMRTWLRWLCLPLLACTLATGFREPVPLAVISEDARLAAVVHADGSLAVNRARPNAFVLEQWQAAYAAPNVLKPAKIEATEGFFCAANLCRAPLPATGYVSDLIIIAGSGEGGVGTTSDWGAALAYCKEPNIIVLAHAPTENPCEPTDRALIVTAQSLALLGAAEIRQDDDTGRLVVRHATHGATRPWHDHRQWSRTARNLPTTRR